MSNHYNDQSNERDLKRRQLAVLNWWPSCYLCFLSWSNSFLRSTLYIHFHDKCSYESNTCLACCFLNWCLELPNIYTVDNGYGFCRNLFCFFGCECLWRSHNFKQHSKFFLCISWSLSHSTLVDGDHSRYDDNYSRFASFSASDLSRIFPRHKCNLRPNYIHPWKSFCFRYNLINRPEHHSKSNTFIRAWRIPNKYNR